MDDDAKKTALRMIPYGIYVATADGGDGMLAAATVNWMTQSSFSPPLIAMGVKTDSGLYAALKKSGKIGVNILGKGQEGLAFAFFRPAEAGEGTINGEPYVPGPATGAPLLTAAHAQLECEVRQIVELGDHHVVVAEVVDASVVRQPEGRPDEAVLEMKNLGEKVFYGG
ncbi:MAG: flavin reductase family protein [Dehalococcoidia bacterium]|nr:flavin reductase family protein [Dehalococcoidia bacterium]MCA9854048.1 flavin reductase family protein [Dehalococcoidia bacterium]